MNNANLENSPYPPIFIHNFQRSLWANNFVWHIKVK